MERSLKRLFTLSLLVMAPVMAQQAPRIPQGLYAEIHIDLDIAQRQCANSLITTAELRAYFNSLYSSLLDNPAVAALFSGTPGTTPMNFLQICTADFSYAANPSGEPSPVVNTDGTTESVTAQALLSLASQELMLIGEGNPTNAARPRRQLQALSSARPCGLLIPSGLVTVTDTV